MIIGHVHGGRMKTQKCGQKALHTGQVIVTPILQSTSKTSLHWYICLNYFLLTIITLIIYLHHLKRRYTTTNQNSLIPLKGFREDFLLEEGGDN